MFTQHYVSVFNKYLHCSCGDVSINGLDAEV